jgi:hypothetical protein
LTTPCFNLYKSVVLPALSRPASRGGYPTETTGQQTYRGL